MGRIQVMSTALANEIAAGEVVVRPASVVKELLENSLDAGAMHIQLKLAEGGIREIVLQDDGMGMDEDDALLAFRRHATSKVFAKPDLDRIRTLGFRGEALASIAAVARVQLITRTANSDRAVSIAIAGGDMGDKGSKAPLQHVGAPVGTRIEVRDLFFNTPARLKYLRTVQTEQSKCVEVVQRAALSRPDVSFSLSTEHSSLFQTPGGGGVRAVLAALYSVGEAKQFLDIEDVTPDYEVYGLIGRPTQGRSSRAYAHLFVNGRPVRNFAVHQAVIEGYRTRLMVGKQPMYAIYLRMDPRLVDVNVHPHKEEVRFSEERDVAQAIVRAVGIALDKTLLAPTPKSRSQEVGIQGQVEEPSTGKAYSTPLHLDWSKPAPPISPPKSTSNPRFVASEQTASARETELIYGESTETVQAPHLRKSNWTLRPIGQALGMYVLADDGESMYIIDQHAAHERILFEEFRNRLIAREVRAMPLLAPFTLSLGPTVFHRVMNCRNALLQVGLSFDEFGAHDIVVRTVPDIWEGLDMESLASDLCDELPEGADAVQRFFHQMHDMLAMRACKAAVKANWHLSSDEMEALCRALPQLDDPFHCPHGRPVFLRFTNQDLEKEFRRIV